MESIVAGNPDRGFWRDKRVFLTGHTGFKGAWLTLMLANLGAQVYGFALPPATNPSLFDVLSPWPNLNSTYGDINDAYAVHMAVEMANPDIAIHMAAQPFVRLSYREPISTFATNVMGTLNVLEALRSAPNLNTILAVTTDKVYRNQDGGAPFVEADALGGHDPYSASKAACEIAIESYSKSYFAPLGIKLASARAGNVIGGGDFSPDRIIPDIFRSLIANQAVALRLPAATRPWQHVLDCLNGYLLYIEALTLRVDVPVSLNFGPDGAPVAVSQVVEQMQAALGARQGWEIDKGPHPKEALVLALNTLAARNHLHWHDKLDTHAAIAGTAGWYSAFLNGEDMRAWSQAELTNFQAIKSG